MKPVIPSRCVSCLELVERRGGLLIHSADPALLVRIPTQSKFYVVHPSSFTLLAVSPEDALWGQRECCSYATIEAYRATL